MLTEVGGAGLNKEGVRGGVFTLRKGAVRIRNRQLQILSIGLLHHASRQGFGRGTKNKGSQAHAPAFQQVEVWEDIHIGHAVCVSSELLRNPCPCIF